MPPPLVKQYYARLGVPKSESWVAIAFLCVARCTWCAPRAPALCARAFAVALCRLTCHNLRATPVNNIGLKWQRWLSVGVGDLVVVGCRLKACIDKQGGPTAY